MKKAARKTRVPLTARSGFGRARPPSSEVKAAASTEPPTGAAPVFRIAGIQMASGPNVSANLNEARRLIEMAVEQGARLVALPEWFACMGLT
jgi:nitrilase